MSEMDITIERASLDNVDTLLELLEQQYNEHGIKFSRKVLGIAIEEMISNQNLGFFLIAREGGPITGMAAVSFAWVLEHGGKSAWLDELYVLPENRGGGIGGMLIEKAVEEATQEGCLAIDLEVDQEHRRVERLYARLGFEPLERTRWVRRL
jgi:GNAT superfamily N-acetyltransferase